MYQGSVEGAKEYFDGMKYPCPANVNPADHYMDVIGGVVLKNNKKFDPNDLFDAWICHISEEQMDRVLEEQTDQVSEEQTDHVSEEQTDTVKNGDCIDGSNIDVKIVSDSGADYWGVIFRVFSLSKTRSK